MVKKLCDWVRVVFWCVAIPVLFAVTALLALCGLNADAQDAAVVQLRPSLAQRAAELHRRQVELNQEWEALRVEIVRVHLEAPMQQAAGCVVNRMLVHKDWGCGEFQFSPDFKLIVPAKQLSGPPWDGPLYELVNGIPTAIKERPQADER